MEPHQSMWMLPPSITVYVALKALQWGHISRCGSNYLLPTLRSIQSGFNGATAFTVDLRIKITTDMFDDELQWGHSFYRGCKTQHESCTVYRLDYFNGATSCDVDVT